MNGECRESAVLMKRAPWDSLFDLEVILGTRNSQPSNNHSSTARWKKANRGRRQIKCTRETFVSRQGQPDLVLWRRRRNLLFNGQCGHLTALSTDGEEDGALAVHSTSVSQLTGRQLIRQRSQRARPAMAVVFQIVP